MRRIVDITIPACAAIAAWPPVLHITPLPTAMVAYVGVTAAWVWSLALGIGFTSITIGVVISKQHPAAAFTLEAIPYSAIGAVFALHVVALFASIGIRAWTAGWWEVGIAAYCFARAAEMWLALRTVRKHAPT